MQKQFEQLRASQLYCPRCRAPRPVRETLLLVVPGGEIHSYRCQACGEHIGTREVKGRRPNQMQRSERGI